MRNKKQKQLVGEKLDRAGRLCTLDGEVCWNFGMHKYKPVKNNIQYLKWYLSTTAPISTSVILNKFI